MVATCLQSNIKPTMKTQSKLLDYLERKYGDALSFAPGKSYYWSPADGIVYYQQEDPSEVGLWTLLHETSHGLLEHKTYQSDFELILLEMEAWEKALVLSRELGMSVDNNHVQDCLDSYRDWQYKRSLCPSCELGGVQIDQKTYKCLFCENTWNVSEARFCRPYRRKASNN